MNLDFIGRWRFIGRFQLLCSAVVLWMFFFPNRWVFAASAHDIAQNKGWQSHIKADLNDGFDWVGSSVLASGVVLAIALRSQDGQWQSSIQRHSNLGEDVLKYGDFFGTGVASLLIAAVQYEYDKPAARALAESVVFAFVSTSLIFKPIIDRRRPNGGRHSMPSGHTSNAFATAASLAYRYGAWWGVPAFLLASFVGYQRVAAGFHWPTDVLAGAALGFFWGRATFFHEYEISPWIEKDGAGVVWNHAF